MSLYGLRDNIFLVEGAHTHAIYDFNRRRLYSINNFTLSFIRRAINSYFEEISLSQKDKECFNFIFSNSIIEPKNQFKPEKKIENHYDSKNKSINSAWIEVTNLCNLRCKHCYSDQNTKKIGSMDLTSFSYVVNELLSIGVKNIQLIGGEPIILQKTLKEMISIVVDSFESIGIFTNATLIDSDLASFLSKNKININTTLFSYSSTDHDRVTMIDGSHKKTNQAIRLLKDYGAQYFVSCVRMDGVEIGEKNTDLYDLYGRNDVVRNSGRANLRLLNHELLQKKIITKKRFTRPLSLKISENLVSGHNCFSEKVYISHDLKVYPCPMERGIQYGSLKENKLNKIIDDSPWINKNCINVCKDCEYRYACIDCRPDRLEDDIYAKPWYCSYNPYKSTWEPIDEFISGIEQKHLN